MKLAFSYTHTQRGKNPVHVHVLIDLHVCQLHVPGHCTMLIHMHVCYYN